MVTATTAVTPNHQRLVGPQRGMLLCLLVSLMVGVSTVMNGIHSSSGSMLRRTQQHRRFMMDTSSRHKEKSGNTEQQETIDGKKRRNAMQQQETLPINEEGKDTTTSDNLQNATISKRELPIRNENGIIIYFLHIPKTGGSTVNVPFLKNWDHSMMVWGNTKHLNYTQEMNRLLDNWQTGDTVYFEHHAGDAPSYLAVRYQLHDWRARAQELGVPFFAFTMYREPVSFALSHFNYYHSRGYQNKAPFNYFPHPTEQDFLDTTLPSPQCLFMSRTELAYRSPANYQALRNGFSETECETSYQALLEDMDWVGVTERMVEETFPLLRHVAGVDFDFKERNRSKKRLSRVDLSEATIQHVREITAWDQRVYERVQKDFLIDMFVNYRSPSTLVAKTDGERTTTTATTE